MSETGDRDYVLGTHDEEIAPRDHRRATTWLGGKDQHACLTPLRARPTFKATRSS